MNDAPGPAGGATGAPRAGAGSRSAVRTRGRQSGEFTRADLLDAARQVLGERGLAHATTKEIARTAGYSEATLYKHFDGKLQLFLAVLAERMPSFGAVVGQLSERVGSGEVVDHLTAVARAALDFYEQSFPVAASLFAEPELLRAHVEVLAQLDNTGPGYPNRSVAAYLAAEQRLGRVAAEADVEAAAAMLVGACFQHAFLRHFEPGASCPTSSAVAGVAGPGAAEEADPEHAGKTRVAIAIATTVARALRD